MKYKERISLGKRLKTYMVFFTVCLVFAISVNVKAATAHSQAEAVNWATAQIGKGLDYDKVYGNQCVDLIKYYYDYLGCANYATGNANAYATNQLPAGWQRVYGNYQPGDIAVWKVNHSCSTCNTGSLGHVGIITSADSVGFNAVNQNFNNTPSCTQNWFKVSALQCAIRPDFGNGSVPSASISYSAINVEWTDTWNAMLKGTISNPSRLTMSSVGVQVWDSAGNMVVNHSEACNLNNSNVYQELNIVGEALPTGLRQGETYTFRMWANANGASCQSDVGSFTIKDDQPPVITDVYVSDVSETGYTVHCTVTDNFKVDRVQFPTWTVYNEQDDLMQDWGSNSLCSGTANGNAYKYRVNISEHNYETGTYITHIYAYDPAGNSICAIVPSQMIEKKQEEPVQPETPTEPTEPTPPTEPTEPTIPTEPTTPTEPTEPTTPTEPTEPTEPTKLETPVEPKKQFYTILFHENGGKNLSEREVTIEENQMIGSLPTVQRKGYLLRGWYTVPSGGMKITSSVRVNKSQTFYAQWEKVTKPKKVKSLVLKKMKRGKVKVSYKKVSGVDGYEIAYCTNRRFPNLLTWKTDTLSSRKTISGLWKGQRYYVRVRAYKVDSTGNRVYGSYSAVKKVKV